ncbi:MAG: polysaccharide deacetylase family protein [Sulfitobacter sp.]
MTTQWQDLETELALWRRDGLNLPLWWRDDDATRVTPALERVLRLGEELALPVHLAVIPEPATPELATYCAETPFAVPLVHGWTHQNTAPEGAKKAEFGHPDPDTTAKSAAALGRMRDLFGDHMLAMFVPPWNRIHPDVVAGLKPQGYVALSTFTPRTARVTAGLVQINTHIDPIHWKGGGGLADENTLIAGVVQLLQDRRYGRTDKAEPLGFLSHHLVHDEAIWDFTQRCLSILLEGGATPCNLSKMRDNLP